MHSTTDSSTFKPFSFFIRKNRISILLLCLIVALVPNKSFGQQDSSIARKQIAIFIPLYLDSAYDATGNYRFGKTIPAYFNQGLEMYEGVQLAIDSLTKEKVPVDIHIFDSRSSKNKLETLAQDTVFQKMNLLIGHVNVNEAASLARMADNMHIPFININLPNDAGITGNKEYIILNPTLSSHAAAIYRHIQKNYPLSPIIYIRKKGVQEDRLKKYFTDFEKQSGSVPLKMKEMILQDSVETEQLKKWLDSSKNTICIVGSLDPNFGATICRQLASISKTYKSSVFGMPTWDQMDFTKFFYKGVEIAYSSPTYINPENKLAILLQNYYKTKFFSRTGDMVYKGFEITYLAAHLPDMDKSLKGKNNTLFGEIDIQPVYNKQTGAIDYYENKRLFFIKKLDGVVKAVY